MRVSFWFLCFLTLDFNNHCSCGVDITNLRDVVEGISISEEEGSVEIDKDHLRKNPECGLLPEKSQTASASSRISNADKTDKHYPWVISVLRRNSVIHTHIQSGDRYCGGSIITQKTAITASHCICGIPKKHASSIPDYEKRFVNCLGGINYDQPPNEIRSYENNKYENKLVASVGDKDRTHQVIVPVLVAYVMGSVMRKSSFQHSFSTHLYEDIGLLITKDVAGNGETFYQHNRPTAGMNIGSVCLAAAIKDAPHMNKGKVVTVGGGTRYSDVKVGNLPEQQKHSCATNEFGPIDAKLRQCDINDLIGKRFWGCNKSGMPDGYDKEKCKKYLMQAEAAVTHEMQKLDNSEILSELWSLTNKIEVSGGLFKNNYICYKEKMFKDNGWCYVFPWWRKPGLKEKNWGFCDSSCKWMQHQNNMPSIYHKMVWQYPSQQPTNCPDVFYNNKDPDENTKPYYMCTASFLPETSVFRFKRDGNRKLQFQNAYKEKIEDTFNSISNDDQKLIGFQHPCSGDSGSGHWMYDSTEKKRALVAISSHLPSTARLGLFCGSPSHILLTTYPNILRWIKKWSDIST